jgi:hypothetical protein
MTNKQIKFCPRCQKQFECKSEEIKNCQCASIDLQQYESDYIFKQYEDCLCISCLKQLRDECESNDLEGDKNTANS